MLIIFEDKYIQKSAITKKRYDSTNIEKVVIVYKLRYSSSFVKKTYFKIRTVQSIIINKLSVFQIIRTIQ